MPKAQKLPAPAPLFDVDNSTKKTIDHVKFKIIKPCPNARPIFTVIRGKLPVTRIEPPKQIMGAEPPKEIKRAQSPPLPCFDLKPSTRTIQIRDLPKRLRIERIVYLTNFETPVVGTSRSEESSPVRTSLDEVVDKFNSDGARYLKASPKSYPLLIKPQPCTLLSLDTYGKQQQKNILNFKSLAQELLTQGQPEDTVKHVSSYEMPNADLRKKMDDPSMQVSRMFLESLEQIG